MFECNSSGILKIINILKDIINIIKIAVPIILIILCMLELTKMVVGDVENQAGNKKKIFSKVLAACVVFLVPTLVNMLINYLSGVDIKSTNCWKNANKEYIEKLEAEEKKLEEEVLFTENTEREKTYEQRKQESLEIRKKIKASSSISTGAVGEIGGIPLNQRMNKLFPAGVPSTIAQMQPYLTTIKVNTVDKNGNEKERSLTVHKYIADEVKAVFDELLALKFPINYLSGYTWRVMASNSNSRSHHSYGVAIDINASSNAATYTSGTYKPGIDPYAVTPEIVNIWKKHGFYWGGDWTGRDFDPMHFTYTNH